MNDLAQQYARWLELVDAPTKQRIRYVVGKNLHRALANLNSVDIAQALEIPLDQVDFVLASLPKVH